MAYAKAEKYEGVRKSRKELMINNFLGGLSWGIGSVIGATLLVAVIGFTLTQLKNVDIIGPIVESIIDVIEEKSSN